MKSKQNLYLTVVQMSYLAAYAAYFNFLLLFMSENGYTTIQGGIAQSATAFVSLVVQPIFGYMTDTYISYKKMIIAGFVIACFTSFLLPMTISYFVLAMITIVFHSTFVKQFSTMINAWTIGIRERDPSVNYGLTRGLGSVGEGLSSFIIGFLIARSGFRIMFISHSILLLIGAIFSLFLIDILPKNKNIINENKNIKKESPKGIVKILLKNKLYITFTISLFFMNLGLKIISIFASLIVKNLGGDSSSFGFIVLVCGVCELPRT